jgi:S-adenosylmethionine:tRNA ribosyltransferase-isomerase
VQIDELLYKLPHHLIAQHPLAQRDRARMLVLNRNSEAPHNHDHVHVAHLPGYLRAGDCLVINDTRVLPARFTGRRSTGGRVEGLYISTTAPDLWSVFFRASGRLRAGQAVELDGADARLHLVRRVGGGRWEVRIEPVQSAAELLERIGWTPLPPYIKRGYSDAADRRIDDEDRRRYQTVYASRPGAVAAPTAGLHLTEDLLNALRAGGVAIAPVTLHVGLGTFDPIKCRRLEDHPMHAEWYDLPEASAAAISSARAAGGRIVAVGTTSARVLETCAGTGGLPRPGRGMTDLFICPPYRFRAVDVLLTNFHLPGSTLLALVFAFAGRDRVLEAYREAIELGYRFYSFGDAMLIL